MCIQGSKLAWCELDVYIFYRRLLSVVYKFNLPFNYQGPGVLCPLTIGISAVDYFFVLIDNCPCKCNIKTCSPDA